MTGPELETVPARMLQADVILVDDNTQFTIKDVTVVDGDHRRVLLDGITMTMHAERDVTVVAESLPAAYWLARYRTVEAATAALTTVWGEVADDTDERAERERLNGHERYAAELAESAKVLRNCARLLGTALRNATGARATPPGT